MPPRPIAIGDIHGCSAALDALLDATRPRPEDTIVTLGDYINRGPDSRGVLDRPRWVPAAILMAQRSQVRSPIQKPIGLRDKHVRVFQATTP